MLEKKAPNKLIVEDTKNDDPSVVELRPEKIEELKLSKGDYCILKGKKRHVTIGVVVACHENDDLTPEKIRIGKATRSNLRLRLGDIVRIEPAVNVPNATKIHVLPLADTIEGIAGDLT